MCVRVILSLMVAVLVGLPGVIRQDRPCGYSPTVQIFNFFPGPGKIVLADIRPHPNLFIVHAHDVDNVQPSTFNNIGRSCLGLLEIHPDPPISQLFFAYIRST